MTHCREKTILHSAVPIGCVLIAGLLSSACTSGRPVHYYALNVPPVAAVAAKPDGPVLVVGRIDTPEALQDGRIRYRSGPNEVGSYEYHRWTERPAMMVRELLVRKLRASGKYHQVQEASSTASGDYLIRGKLHEFSEIDNPGIQTRVSLQLEVLDRKSGLVIWDRHFDRDEPVSGKAIQEVVVSLDHNLQQVTSDAAAAIGTFLSTRSGEGSAALVK
jgi:ABC-type uncharacterized transport system auxiliary subunit